MTDDDSEDPFERLGDPDREGDPFERLDDADGEGATPADPSEDEAATDEQSVPSDPFAGLDREPGGSAAASGPPTEDESPAIEAGEDGEATATPDPFTGMGERSGDPFSGGDNVFERVDVGSVEADEVWASITGEGEGEEPVAPDESRYATVSKHAFCEQCEHFAEPPDAHCTHETAEIIEYLDMEQVRLLDCPIVAERKDLE